MQLGGPCGAWGLHRVLWNLTHLWAQISSLQDQAPHLPPVTPQDFSEAMWFCFKTLPFVKLKDKYGRIDTSVHLSCENWCLLRKCQCWIWKTHFGVSPAQKDGFALSIPDGSTCAYCHGGLRDVTPFKSLHFQTHSHKWAIPFLAEELCVSAVGFLVHTFVVQGQGVRTAVRPEITHVGRSRPLCVFLEASSRADGKLLSPHCSLNIHLTGQDTNLTFKNKYVKFLRLWSGWVSQCAV